MNPTREELLKEYYDLMPGGTGRSSNYRPSSPGGMTESGNATAQRQYDEINNANTTRRFQIEKLLGIMGSQDAMSQGSEASNMFKDDYGAYKQGLSESEARLSALLDDPDSIQQSAAYKFRVGQGQEALQRQLGAKGLLNSGNRLMELTKYGQDMASQEYDAQAGRLKDLVDQKGKMVLGIGGLYGSAADSAAKSALEWAKFNQANSSSNTMRMGGGSGMAVQQAAEDPFDSDFFNIKSEYLGNLSGYDTAQAKYWDTKTGKTWQGDADSMRSNYGRNPAGNWS